MDVGVDELESEDQEGSKEDSSFSQETGTQIQMMAKEWPVSFEWIAIKVQDARFGLAHLPFFL